MMTKRCKEISILLFLEPMDHDNLSVLISLKKEGYRLDPKGRGKSTKKGIKCTIGYGKFKSVDYLYETNNRAYLVEFSDLWDQHLDVLRRVRNIQGSNLPVEDKRNLVEKEESIIRKELIEKFKDSVSILKAAHIKLVDWTEALKKGSYRYRVIVAKTPGVIGSKKSVEVDFTMFLSRLQAQLRAAMKYDNLCVDVKLSPIDIWANSKNY